MHLLKELTIRKGFKLTCKLHAFSLHRYNVIIEDLENLEKVYFHSQYVYEKVNKYSKHYWYWNFTKNRLIHSNTLIEYS